MAFESIQFLFSSGVFFRLRQCADRPGDLFAVGGKASEVDASDERQGYLAIVPGAPAGAHLDNRMRDVATIEDDLAALYHVGLLLNFCFGTTSMDSSPSIGDWWPTILMPLRVVYPPSPPRALFDHRANGISPLNALMTIRPFSSKVAGPSMVFL